MWVVVRMVVGAAAGGEESGVCVVEWMGNGHIGWCCTSLVQCVQVRAGARGECSGVSPLKIVVVSVGARVEAGQRLLPVVYEVHGGLVLRTWSFYGIWAMW
jgi:hypothetical protein